MQLALSTWQEVEEYLRSSVGIIIPIGSVEQHGPNGLIGTDHLCAEVVAKGVGDAIGCMVAPTLAYGMSQHHLGFAGSVTLRPSTLMLVVCDVVQSLATHGFRKFFFINGHGVLADRFAARPGPERHPALHRPFSVTERDRRMDFVESRGDGGNVATFLEY
jgi:creatinine amidohydrolase/Fe(II)-dependent formamide hydrolase-like protein